MKLCVEGGCFAYEKGGRQVIQDISFEVNSGDILAVLGPNGAGKTTLLRCVMGFLRWQRGRSLLDGEDMRTLSQRALFSKIAYVPQARNSATAYTVEETILMGRSGRMGMFARPGSADVKRCDEVIERLGIGKLRGKRCSEISGGELQMVLIARALAAEPGLLILDEPESNLDFRNQLIVLRTMSELAAEGMGCIFNTHFPAHALQRANRALLLGRDGRALFGGAGEVITEPNIEAAFGVRAVIGEIETEGSQLRDVLPLSVAREAGGELAPEDLSRKRLAVVSVITADYENGERINALLHEYSNALVGRMGMPYRARNAHIINVTVDAPEREIRELTARLGRLPATSVKVTYAPEDGERTGESL